ncbi:MAG: proline hydroxylase, partial [Betaproteobacteria bacterium]|nr:proline hydroxylase [Betaproteobacteria bacterium]
MKQLSQAQLKEFDEKGFLFFPSLFDASEIDSLTSQLEDLFAQDMVCNVREKGSKSVRTNFAAHNYNQAFARLS